MLLTSPVKSRRTLPPLLSAVSLSLCLSFRSPRLSLAGLSRLSSPPYLSLCASPFAAHASVLPESPPLLTAISLSLCLSFRSPRLSLAGVSPSPHRRISLSVPLLSDVSVSPDLILSTLSSPIHFDLGLLARSPSLNPSLAGSLSSRSSSSAVILAGLPPSLSRNGSFAPRKKGRLYGVGSLNTSLRSVPASFPSSSTRDQSLEKIIYDQAQKIESQENEISKLYKIVRHLASKDSTVADILLSEDVSSASGDDDESDAI
ncbi:hypothetical protein YC2023_076074 [Brassica napus]